VSEPNGGLCTLWVLSCSTPCFNTLRLHFSYDERTDKKSDGRERVRAHTCLGSVKKMRRALRQSCRCGRGLCMGKRSDLEANPWVRVACWVSCSYLHRVWFEHEAEVVVHYNEVFAHVWGALLCCTCTLCIFFIIKIICALLGHLTYICMLIVLDCSCSRSYVATLYDDAM